MAIYKFHREILMVVDEPPFTAPFWGRGDHLHAQILKTCDHFDGEILKRIHNFHIPVQRNVFTGASLLIDGLGGACEEQSHRNEK